MKIILWMNPGVNAFFVSILPCINKRGTKSKELNPDRSMYRYRLFLKEKKKILSLWNLWISFKQTPFNILFFCISDLFIRVSVSPISRGLWSSEDSKKESRQAISWRYPRVGMKRKNGFTKLFPLFFVHSLSFLRVQSKRYNLLRVRAHRKLQAGLAREILTHFFFSFARS